MFIPPGSTIHESLATSYVLVDALVSDLCEGGFSGVVEVVLRDTDSFIVISNGDVAAVVEKSVDQMGAGATDSYTRTTVEQLADRSRRERGRVSIYGYSAAAASAVAGRINAQALYVGLSTEFTDIEKMIAKLVREPDREWFIEVSAGGVPSALIHMRDTECRIVRPTGDTNSGMLDLTGNSALSRLVDECNRAGSTFDVYFSHVAETTNAPVGRPGLESTADLEPIPEPSSAEAAPAPAEAALLSEAPIGARLASFRSRASGELPSDELYTAESPVVHRLTIAGIAGPVIESDDWPAVSSNGDAGRAATQPSMAPLPEVATPEPARDSIQPQGGDLSLEWDEFPSAAADAEAMAEIKRLMGEIARAIEEAAQAVGRPDSFSMSLRAGQLKIADRFPFLDPFAGDFEYLAGEIVFVGRASAEEFVIGLTEALKLAIEAVTRSTAYADRFRSYVVEDLQKLLARERAAFDSYGLDQVIQQIGAF